MRLRSFAAIAALALFAAAGAHAQVASIYVTSANLRASSVQTGSLSTSSGYQNQFTTFWSSGIGGGVTLNFLPLPVVSLGFDFRGSTKPGTAGADSALVGIKLGIHPPIIRIKPYIQASAGYLATRTVNVSTGNAGGTFSNEYAVYEVLGGIDYPLVHFVDLRLIEVGGGQAILNGSSNNPSLFSINSGLVLHF